ncbi:ABC-2 transporter permease [Thermophilibacter immobilis]|uniref:ABC-2 transporter permease n=1 Tax=Thermophilibacter immobilis TaxID=2779519 RepID=A0A7S7M9I4_9ACTN|nr:ABC-2 transporter permease [Thermophilibacter immobilis]QOY61181.1 ABC-2 transporter permease [Thermophilibacter immobilis]
MRALLYADWCAVRTRRSLLFLLVSLATSVLIAQGTSEVITSQNASLPIIASAASCLTMSSYFLLTVLFGADEQNSWEAYRLAALPVTPRQVVRSRYAFVALSYGALLALAVPSATICLGAAEMIRGRVPAMPLPTTDTLLALALVAGVILVLVAAQMAIVFALGMQRARVALLLPYLVFFGGSPWMGDVLAGLGAQAPGDGPIALLAMACVAAGALFYLACMHGAQALYARREL